MRKIVTAVTATASAYAVACAALAWLFTHADRASTAQLWTDPSAEGLTYEDVTFGSRVDGVRLSGWFIPARGTSAVLMIPGGGLNRLNGRRSSGQARIGSLRLARALHDCGHSVLMYDPRATGRSDGDRFTFGYLEARDVLGAYDLLAARGYERQLIGVIGWSAGGAAAMFALPDAQPGCLILDSALGKFDTEDVVRYAASMLHLPSIALALPTRVLMMGVIGAARAMWGVRLDRRAVDSLQVHPVPTLVIHGLDDRQVPLRVAQAIAAAAGERLIGTYFVGGTGHGGAYGADPARYAQVVNEALSDHFR